ncbi:MAG: DNA alkylation repair protein [Myxococcota bacterium]
MLEPDVVSELLELVSDPKVARRRGKELQSLRGVRGVPHGELARVANAVWQDQRPTMREESALTQLFGTAWEDGIVAIGLLAALLPSTPADALDLARDWCERIDDHETADAMGMLILGPGALASGGDAAKQLLSLLRHRRPAVRRAAVMAGMAMVPEEVTGPAVAPLRAQLGTDGVMFVDKALDDELAGLANAALRDENPSVRKALRRVLAGWALHSPDAAEAWLGSVRGGTPKILREAVEKGAKKSRRKARKHAEWLAQESQESQE